MRSFMILTAAALLLSLAAIAAPARDRARLKAVASSQDEQTASTDGVRRITPAAVREALNKGQAVIIDVRGEGSYEAGHIRGARLIPVNEILERASELPRDKMIITYCS